jgi:glycosyltransferase involved in cell wall biosynthesis
MLSKVIYLCGVSNGPVGGHKVIYRHAKVLKKIGLDCTVFHPAAPSYRAHWFDDQPEFLERLSINPAKDFLIIPEKYALNFGPRLLKTNTSFAVFVQNGFLCHKTLEAKDLVLLKQVYSKADLILTVSETIGHWLNFWFPTIGHQKIFRISPAVSDLLATASAPKERLITFMPRKSAEDVRNVLAMCDAYCPPGWEFSAIDQLTEQQAAMLLQRSSIFLSFSQREGLGLPPIEAAIAGNLVVGYTGSAGRDYFKAPIFTEVAREEFLDFVQKILLAIKQVESGVLNSNEVKAHQAELLSEYSRANEKHKLILLSEKIQSLFK